MRKRLPLSFSSADKWLHCPGFGLVLAAHYKTAQRDSPEAAEGTRAHAYLESLLKKTAPKFEGQIANDPDDEENQRALIEGVAADIKQLAALGGYELRTEMDLKVEIAGHEMRGRIDVLLISKEEIFIIDYKHGQGKHVSVAYNPQLMGYALLVREHFPGIPLTLGVYQPRGVGEGLVDWRAEEEVLEEYYNQVALMISEAYVDYPAFVTGDHCRNFCPGMQGLCPAQLGKALRGAFESDWPIDEVKFPSWVLDVGPGLKQFVDKVTARAIERIEAGDEVPGWGLRMELGKSAWISPKDVAIHLAALLGGDTRDYSRVEVKPITITEAKRRIGGAANDVKEIFDALIHRPSYKRLAPISECDTTADPKGFGSIENLE